MLKFSNSCALRWAGVDVDTPDAAEGIAPGMVGAGFSNTVDAALESEQRSRMTDRADPNPAGPTGHYPLRARLFCEESLRDSGVRFVRTARAAAFDLVVETRGGIELPFQCRSAEHRRWAPLLIRLADFFRDFKGPTFGVQFMFDYLAGEQRFEFTGRDRISRRRHHRRHPERQVGLNVVPAPWHLARRKRDSIARNRRH